MENTEKMKTIAKMVVNKRKINQNKFVSLETL